jgi:hypothetical protein
MARAGVVVVDRGRRHGEHPRVHGHGVSPTAAAR